MASEIISNYSLDRQCRSSHGPGSTSYSASLHVNDRVAPRHPLASCNIAYRIPNMAANMNTSMKETIIVVTPFHLFPYILLR